VKDLLRRMEVILQNEDDFEGGGGEMALNGAKCRSALDG